MEWPLLERLTVQNQKRDEWKLPKLKYRMRERTGGEAAACGMGRAESRDRNGHNVGQ